MYELQSFVNAALYWSNTKAQGASNTHASFVLVLAEPMWHVAASSRCVSVGSAPRRQNRQDVPGKDSPNRHSKVIIIQHMPTQTYIYLRILIVSFHLFSRREKRITPVTPAVTLSPATRPAVTATSAGLTGWEAGFQAP